MSAYRVTITIEAFENEEELLNEDADPSRIWTNYATSNSREKIFEAMNEALSKLDEDPLNGTMWEG